MDFQSFKDRKAGCPTGTCISKLQVVRLKEEQLDEIF